MTSPGSYSNLVSRGDAAPLAAEQTSSAMSGRKAAATRGVVRADGAVHVHGKHVGKVYRAGLAWRARTPGGQQLGLHTSRSEAVGALVTKHEGSAC